MACLLLSACQSDSSNEAVSKLTLRSGEIFACATRIDGVLTVAVGEGDQRCTGNFEADVVSEPSLHASARTVDLADTPWWIQDDSHSLGVLLLPARAQITESTGDVLAETRGSLDDLGEAALYLIDLAECDLTSCFVYIDYEGRQSRISSSPTDVRPSVPDVPPFEQN